MNTLCNLFTRKIMLVIIVLLATTSIKAQYQEYLQTSFTVSGNEVTVKLKSSETLSSLTFSAYSVSFRFLESYGINFVVTQSNFAPVGLIQQGLDPNDPLYRNFKFGFNGGASLVNFTAGTEYDVFKFTVNGGDGTGIIGLCQDNTNYSWTPDYIFNNFTYFYTNYTDPFYGVNLTNSDFTLAGESWFWRTSNVFMGKFWLATAASVDWNTGSNWSDGIVPPASWSVTIFPGPNQPVISSTDVTLNNVTLEDNATIEIAFDATLTVNVTITQGTGNKVIVKSTDAGTGSLIHNTAGINGELQRHMQGWGDNEIQLKNGRGWHLLSSPVASQLNAPFQNLSDNDDFLKWNEVGNAWENRRMPDNSLNSSFETTFGIGKGYLVAYEDDKTNLFQGVLNVANVSVSGLTNTWTAGPVNYYGHHLIGNPFASALEWGTGDWNRTNVENHVQIWNEFNASYSVIGVGDPIPAMQGFFVYTPGSGSLTIPASARIHSAQPFYKSTNDQILLVARDLDHQMLQESKVSFNADATELYDLEYDSYYMAGYAPTFYSVSNGEAFALNTLPEINDDLTIPFVFVKNDGTNFSISLEKNIEGTTLYLVDLKANQTINLSEVNQYSFISVAGDNPDRFLLKFSPVGINDVINNTSVNIFAYGNTLYLNSSEYLGNTIVSVFDMLGREILQKQITLDGQTAINLSGYQGAYIVRAVTDREIVSTKVYFR